MQTFHLSFDLLIILSLFNDGRKFENSRFCFFFFVLTVEGMTSVHPQQENKKMVLGGGGWFLVDVGMSNMRAPGTTSHTSQGAGRRRPAGNHYPRVFDGL